MARRDFAEPICHERSIPGATASRLPVEVQNHNTQRRTVAVTAIGEQKLRRRIRELASRHVYWGRRLVY